MTTKTIIDIIRAKTGFICDMDGVIYHGNQVLDGVTEFVSWLKEESKKFVFLTNSSERTVRDLREKLLRMDTDIVAGIEPEIDTCLVLSGITSRKSIQEFAYHPKYIPKGVSEIVKDYPCK